MADIIKLLPDSVANQIAAGEVIQRPASVVKELMENAIDAGADEIRLIVKDAGRTLIQVIDNGCGMSETDARLCFERHATSKINAAKDLFSIHTMGFRGEALASICAIAHVELKTRRNIDELGTLIVNEGTHIKSQEPCQCEKGTSFSVKNLFFNVPARRNFLKSDQIELRHIDDEFLRLAIAHPHVNFTFFHNNKETYHLQKESLKKRLVACFGESYNQRLVPLEHKSELVNITGFISKPEFARKTRGEQYFFTNNRFMKHAYLNHAVFSAFENIIKPDSFPSFFIFIQINPEQIDINIHPTKTEIKFQDERLMYSYLHATVKKALGVHNVMPSIDFDKSKEFDFTPLGKDAQIKPPTVKVNTSYNPFEKNSPAGYSSPSHLKTDAKQWKTLYEEILHKSDSEPEQTLLLPKEEEIERKEADFSLTANQARLKFLQIQDKYILTQIKSGLLFVDQQAAHERILFEKFLIFFNNKKAVSQQLLFPQVIELSPADAELTNELLKEIRVLGFQIEHIGKNNFNINGMPTDVKNEDVKIVIEKMLESYKGHLLSSKFNKNENIAASLAKNLSVKSGNMLHNEEMNDIIDRLFACEIPYVNPTGKPTFIILPLEELELKFLNKKI
ncbi:MAG: DNA mismatch repair endonuclease MutL [Bacteroidales bacterium]|nr:DNA mismatch repair endonuclease MutL [Bacteroidales bacterium]